MYYDNVGRPIGIFAWLGEGSSKIDYNLMGDGLCARLFVISAGIYGWFEILLL